MSITPQDIAILASGGVAAGILLLVRRRKTKRYSNGAADAVVECGAALANSTNYEEALLTTVKAAVLHSGATAGYLMLLEEDGSLRTECAYSPNGAFIFPEYLSPGVGTSGYVATSGQPTRVCQPGKGDAGSGEFDAEVKAVVSVPIQMRGDRGIKGKDIIGVLTVIHQTDPNAFAPDKIDRLSAFAAIVAMAAANQRMEYFQKQTLTKTLERISNALEAKDSFMGGHSLRVSAISVKIAEKLGLTGEVMEEIRLGTILHDIGKVAIPDAILNKKGKLSDDEFALLRNYPVVGYDICQELSLPQGVLLLIRNHHEKLDGTGYPDGLKGGELTLPMRIIAVADAFDAMTSARAYRQGLAPADVIVELARAAGTAYDPVVVQTLRELILMGELAELYPKPKEDEPEQEERQAS